MVQTVCDRCGNAIVKPHRHKRLETRFWLVHFSLFNGSGTPDEIRDEFDLCEDCAKTLWDWLYKTPAERKGDV